METRQLLNSIKSRKIRYHGHVTRKPSCLEKDIVQGCVSGSRSRGIGIGIVGFNVPIDTL